MVSRFPLVVAASVVALWAPPAWAAEYKQSGNWVFYSKAFAEDGEAMVYACIAGTESGDGTELSLRLEPAADDGIDAAMSLGNDGWTLDEGAVRLRLDIGADHWMLHGQGGAQAVGVRWTGDPALLTFLEDLASSSFAGLIGRDGATVAQFSLKGSRGAIEAMTACVEEQVGRGLAEVLATGTGADTENPF